MSYTEINIGTPATSKNLADAVDSEDTMTEAELPIEPVEVVEEEIVEEKEEIVEEAVQPEQKKEVEQAASKQEKTDTKPSRAQERIRQLANEKTEAQQVAQKLAEENAALQKQLLDGNKSSGATKKELLEESLDTLAGSLKEAMENGDSALTIQLQDQRHRKAMELAGLTAELQQLDNTPEPKATKVVQQGNAIPPKAMDWIEATPLFKTDNMFHRNAMLINGDLVAEGFSDTSDDFYLELDKRLEKLFPSAFDKTDKNDVQYKEDTSKGVDDVKPTPIQEETPPQTVAGSSRTPVAQKGKKSARSSDTVKLDASQVQMAERWGLDLKTMARRVNHIENESNGGYTPIKIK
tara:strand:+ start:5792 stop:6844 length:1053 start_codon:yes stop_codon:yes gene_type:complete